MAKRPKGLPKKSWSLLAYIAGDNNLSDAGLEDIQEMCAVGSSKAAYAAVQIDTRGEYDGVVRYEISPPDGWGEAHRIVLQRMKELDSGSPRALRDFLKWGIKRYPADKRVVVVWNHGSGFRTVRRDIAFDDGGSALDMNELDGALAAAGLGPESRISILGFDACLMNMAEIVHHLRNRTEYVVGSEQTEPGDGWPYDQVLALLNADPGAAAAAAGIVDVYVDSYKAIGESNITQSAVKTDAMDAVLAALGGLGSALVAAMAAGPDARIAVGRARTGVQSYEEADYVDLGDLAARISARLPDPAVQAAAAAILAALQGAVIRNGTIGGAVSGSTGLTVWFPADRGLYLSFRSKYMAMDCAAMYPGWVDFLDTFLA